MRASVLRALVAIGRGVVAPLRLDELDVQVEAGGRIAGHRIGRTPVVELLRRRGAARRGVGAQRRRIVEGRVRPLAMLVEVPTGALALGEHLQIRVADRRDHRRVPTGAGEHGMVELTDEINVLRAS